MRNLLLLIVLSVCIVPGVSFAGIIGKPANNLGLIGYWPFNDGGGFTATDASGYNHTGTLSVPGSLPWASGKLGGAIDFPGSFVGVVTTYNSDIQPPPNRMTISAWIKPRSGGQDLIGAIWYQGIGPQFAMCGVGSGSCVNDNSMVFGAYQWSGGANGWTTGVNSIRMNEWQHVVVTYDQTSSSNDPLFYINGALVSSADIIQPTGSVGASNPANIGAASGNWGFDGLIDEVRVYNRILSAAEVAALYRSGGSAVGASSNVLGSGGLKLGLVGHWTMDGGDVTDKVYDRSGQASHGYFRGGATTSAKVLGKLGQSLRFNGTSNSIDAGSASSLDDLDTITISAWIKPDTSMAGSGEIFDKTNDGGVYTDGPDLWYDPTDSNKLWFAQGFTGGGGYGAWYVNNSPIVLGQWQHVALVYSRTSASNNPVMYINGMLQTTTADVSQPALGTARSDAGSDVIIGGYGTINVAGFFKGSIDDVRVYNRLLSQSEVKQLYGLGVQSVGASTVVSAGGINAGLLGYWTFDGPDVTDKVYDRSGNGNNGYYIGAATSTKKTLGKLGQALSFDGSTNYVSLGATGSLNITGAITISAWVKFTDLNCSSGCDIVANYNSAGDTAQYEMSMINGEIGYSSAASGSFPGGTTDTTPITSTNRWYHVLVTRNATGVRTADTVNVYVDGVLQTGTFTTGTPPGAGFGATAIGRDGDSVDPSFYFPGLIDDVRVYNRALSASEAKQLYNLGK